MSDALDGLVKEDAVSFRFYICWKFVWIFFCLPEPPFSIRGRDNRVEVSGMNGDECFFFGYFLL